VVSVERGIMANPQDEVAFRPAIAQSLANGFAAYFRR
jgi:hypothetical protein